jgi:hypothetical protein
MAPWGSAAVVAAGVGAAVAAGAGAGAGSADIIIEELGTCSVSLFRARATVNMMTYDIKVIQESVENSSLGKEGFKGQSLLGEGHGSTPCQRQHMFWPKQ